MAIREERQRDEERHEQRRKKERGDVREILTPFMGPCVAIAGEEGRRERESCALGRGAGRREGREREAGGGGCTGI